MWTQLFHFSSQSHQIFSKFNLSWQLCCTTVHRKFYLLPLLRLLAPPKLKIGKYFIVSCFLHIKEFFSRVPLSLSCLSVGWMLQMGDVVIMPYPITEAPPPQSKIHIIIIILNSMVTIFIVGHLLGGWPTMASDFLILFKSTNSNGTSAITAPCNDGNSCIKWESIITIKLSKERGKRIYSPLVDTHCNCTLQLPPLGQTPATSLILSSVALATSLFDDDQV